LLAILITKALKRHIAGQSNDKQRRQLLLRKRQGWQGRQKALIALYENATPFSWRMLAPGDGAAMTELEAL
jgi:hypothetical protein